jgi:hypothetical protein
MWGSHQKRYKVAAEIGGLYHQQRAAHYLSYSTYLPRTQASDV